MTERIFAGGDAKRLEEFIGMGSGERLLFYHGDADGVCSAALFLRFFTGFSYSPRKGPAMGDDFVKMVLDKKPELMVFLDMAANQEREKLEMFLREMPNLRIVIIDHHISEKMESERVLHINPRFVNAGAYIPASCVTYRLLEELGKDVRPFVWIAAMGVIGDYGWPECRELIRECREEYPFLLRDEPPRSMLGRGANAIAAATTVKGLSGVAECLRLLLDAEGFEDFESSEKLNEWKKEFDIEFRELVDDFERNREFFERENLFVYEVSSRLNLTSVLSTHLGERFPDSVVAIRKPEGDGWKVSLRNQSGRVNLGDVVRKAVKGIGSGGGHEKAAAALVNDWSMFLKRLRKLLSESS